MIELKRALEALRASDTLAKTIQAGSTATAVQLASGQAAAFAPGMLVNFTGSAAIPTGNNYAVRTIAGIALSTDRMTLDRALPVAPTAGDLIRGGLASWCAGLYEAGQEPTPLLTVLDADPGTAHQVIAIEQNPLEVTERAGFARIQGSVELEVAGNDPWWVDGFCRRLDSLLDQRPSALTIAGYRVHELTSEAVPLKLRADRLASTLISIVATVTALEAA